MSSSPKPSGSCEHVNLDITEESNVLNFLSDVNLDITEESNMSSGSTATERPPPPPTVIESVAIVEDLDIKLCSSANVNRSFVNPNLGIEILEQPHELKCLSKVTRERSAMSYRDLDIDKISTWATEELMKLCPLSNECCIYRIPKGLRKLNQIHYTPQVVSIGPIHHGKKKLKAMEEHKKRYLGDFLRLAQVGVEECIRLIQEKEIRLRNCYAESIELSSEAFIKMTLLDAAFIIMVLLKSWNLETQDSDRMFKKPMMMNQIRYELLLLENQLPFFILEDLYKLSKLNDRLKPLFDPSKNSEFTEEQLALIELTCCFFKRWITKEVSTKIYSLRGNHLLDFLRISYIPLEWNREMTKLKTLNAPSVKELHQAGVKLVRSKENIFNIKFGNGVLEIPLFQIQSSTELLFRNIQAFELCHCLDPYFNDYIAIMVQLVKTHKDAELLVEKSIIENWASDIKEITTLFHDLDSRILISDNSFTYSDLIEDLNKHYEARWPKWKAILKQNYFNTPWASLSVIAAAVLLILTIIQTVCSLIQVI